MKTIKDFLKAKEEKRKLSMVTCYDACFAKLIAQTSIDMILVGDSGSMVMHGHSTTLPASVENMVDFVASVRRGAPDAFIVGDMPFLAHRKGLEPAMSAVQQIMAAGANAVKIEGVVGHEVLLAHIVDSGVPVVAHLGLTPQSIHQLGGFKVQGREEKAAEALFKQAKEVQEAGCFALVLECVPTRVAAHITGELHIPTIGIGAGPHTDGQVLVLHDMLGLNEGFKPKFLRQYLNGAELVKTALEKYSRDVASGEFPLAAESYE